MNRANIDRLKDLFRQGMEYWGRGEPVPEFIRKEASGYSSQEREQASKELFEEANQD